MWTLSDLHINLNELNEIARDNGYFLSLNGSVLFNGASLHDLDIIACKFVDCADEQRFLEELRLFVDGTIVDTYNGIFANAYVIEVVIHNESHLIDLSIRK